MKKNDRKLLQDTIYMLDFQLHVCTIYMLDFQLRFENYKRKRRPDRFRQTVGSLLIFFYVTYTFSFAFKVKQVHFQTER